MPVTLSDWAAGYSTAPGAHIDPSATIGPRTTIGASAFIGAGVTIGSDCVIKPGAVIGCDGFGYRRDHVGDAWTSKPHEHGVVIGDDVHIGSNTCIDRGSWRDTTIHAGARIDNLVHIAHNVIVGHRAVVVAQAELSGSVVVEEGAWVGPRACVRERLTIGARALVGIGAVVVKDVPANVTVAGCPAKITNAEVGVRDEM